MASEEKSPAAASAAAAPGTPKTAPLVLILNTLALIGVMSFTFYSKFSYKREVITEEGERHRLELLGKGHCQKFDICLSTSPPHDSEYCLHAHSS